MIGNLGQIMNLVKNAGQIKENIRTMQERMAAARFVGEAGAGQVRATVDGRGELLTVDIDPAALPCGDAELLGELVCASVRDAVSRSREAARKELEAATGGVDLGGMMDMFGAPK